MSELTITQIIGVPLIQPGDNIAKIIFDAIKNQNTKIEEGNILVVTSKIISKAENRLRNISEVSTSENANIIGAATFRDPRLVELILSESNEVVRATRQAIIVEHHSGFICANAGIDHSNVRGNYGNNDDWYLLLPEDSDRSANIIREYFLEKTGINVGVLIVDSHGRPWRKGTVGAVIGVSNVPAIVDLRGHTDIFGYKLRISEVAAADELAGAASLMMGQADEMIPAVLIKGFPYALRSSSTQELLRTKNSDLFR